MSVGSSPTVGTVTACRSRPFRSKPSLPIELDRASMAGRRTQAPRIEEATEQRGAAVGRGERCLDTAERELEQLGRGESQGRCHLVLLRDRRAKANRLSVLSVTLMP